MLLSLTFLLTPTYNTIHITPFPLLFATFQFPTTDIYSIWDSLILFKASNSEKSMEDEMGSGQSTNLETKPVRKRCRSTRGSSSKRHSIINLVGTRREIAYALQMHRSPSSSPPCITESEAELPVIGKVSNFEIDMPMFSGAQYCYSLLEAMPLPGPIWSTTSPCVLAEPPAPVPAPSISSTASSEASLEFEWGESQASSYSWWLGFLKSLDGNRTSERLNCSFLENNNTKVFNHEYAFVDAMDHSCCPDDWLMIPTMDKEDLGDMVMP